MTPTPSNENPAPSLGSTQITEEDGQEVEAPVQNSEKPVTPPAGKGARFNKSHETPLKYSASSHLLFTSLHYERDMRYAQAEVENRGKFVSMDPQEFFTKFLPADSSKPFKRKATAQENLLNAARCKREIDSYSYLSDALSEYCPSLEIINTSNHLVTVTWGRQEVEIKPDLSVNLKNGGVSNKARGVDIDKVEVMIEGKWVGSDDAFDDKPKNPFERDTAGGRDTRGQITMYATAQLARQHRSHCFSVLFVKSQARILRWDRAGAVVTKRFNYVREPWLAKFFHWYEFASPSARGIDTSVEKLLGPGPFVKEAREALNIRSTQPLYKFEIVDDATGHTTHYIGSEPMFNPGGSFTGRCTRCYEVYDVERKKIVLMKDTWRVDEKDATKEGEIYRLLKERGVPNILTLITYGDVRNQDVSSTRQTTQTQLLTQQRGHCHARLVFEEICRDLTHFETTGEIVSAIGDAIEAHQGAYDDAQIIHRDVSVGNIMIMPNGKGTLIDWDLSKLLDKKGTPRQNQRTGTWQFMSAKLLANPNAPVHELADDLESFYHVLVWVVVRFTPHPMSKRDLMDLLHAWFDEALPRTGDVPRGGRQKGTHFKFSYIRTESQLPRGHLRNLIVDLEAVLRIRYAEQPTQSQLNTLKRLRERHSQGNIDERAYIEELTDNPAWQHTEYTEHLTSHTWMHSRFRDSLTSDMLDKRVVHDVTASKDPKQETRVLKRSSEFAFDPEERPTRRRKLDRAAKNIANYTEELIAEEAEEADYSMPEDYDDPNDEDYQE